MFHSEQWIGMKKQRFPSRVCQSASSSHKCTGIVRARVLLSQVSMRAHVQCWCLASFLSLGCVVLSKWIRRDTYPWNRLSVLYCMFLIRVASFRDGKVHLLECSNSFFNWFTCNDTRSYSNKMLKHIARCVPKGAVDFSFQTLNWHENVTLPLKGLS